MSAEVRGVGCAMGRSLEISPSVITDGAFYLGVSSDSDTLGIHVERADFLAAASSELGVVIIDKADLPEVVWSEGMERWETIPDERGIHAERGDDPDWFEARAQEYQAMAIHLRANPPVDEAQVSALAEIVRAATDTPADAYIGADLTAEGIARRLVATGKVEVRS